jgi:hypothetical protein
VAATRSFRPFLPLLFLAFTSLAQDGRATGTAPVPAAGKALVVFFRPATGTAFLDGARHTLFVVRDSQDPLPIGIGGGGSKVAYQADPGKHLFMVIGETADFMEAELLPDSTYHVTVAVAAGAWRARYQLRPTDAQDRASNDFKALLASAQWADSSTAQAWAAANMPSIKRRQGQYYPAWRAKPEAEKPVLGPSGRVEAR